KNVQNPNQKKPNRNPPQKPAASKPVAPPPPKSALLTTEDWQRAPLKALELGEVDRLIAKELQQDKIEPAALTTDEQFIRRVTLDLTGELPVPADVTEFVADKAANKRAKLIDKLLTTEEYAKHWARYWRDVVVTHITAAPQIRFMESVFESWLEEEIAQNHSWGAIARAMIAADGEVHF